MKSRIGILVVTGFAACSLSAQDTRGEILGRVVDPSGAAMSGAKVTAVNTATNVAASAVSGATGDYLLPLLNEGAYRLTVEAAGFRIHTRDAVTIRTGESTTIDVQLALVTGRESVQVEARAPLLDPANPASGMIVESETIVQLPLRDGNPVMLSILAPGVINLSEGGTTRAYDNENASAIAVNGASSGSHEFKIDGASNTGGASGNVAYVPPAGAVSEFKIETSPFDARNGFSSGAAINLSLKPGVNRPHVQVYYYLENPAANANSFFSNKASRQDNFRENRGGATASGPLQIPGIYRGRNRTFWMYGYENIHASQPYGGSNLTYTVPSAQERGGNFADLLAYGSTYQIYDPATTRPATTAGRYTRDPIPGNIIPASRLSQTAVNVIIRYYPLPNLPGAKPTGVNFAMPSLQANRFGNHTLRIDHAIGQRQRLAIRANMSDRGQDLQRRFNDGAGTQGERENRGAGIDDAVILSANLVMSVRYSYTRYVDNYAPPSTGLDITSLGFSSTYRNQILAVDAGNLMLPDITPTGYAELNGQAAIRLASDIHALASEFTRVARNHTLRFGGEYRIYRDASGNTGRSSGKLNFNTNWTRGPLDNAASSPMGQGLASFLLGLPTDGSMDVNPSLAQQYQVSGWYVQDNWKISPRLTLNAGVRWEYEIPLTERYDRSVGMFNPNAAVSIAAAAQAAYAKSPIAQIPAAAFQVRGGLTFAGVNGVPRTLWDSDLRNFAPRIGIAWLMDRKTVLRAGFGTFYDVARQNAIQTGFSRTTTLVASQNTGQTYVASLDNPFPNGFSLPTGSSLGTMTNAGQTISAFPERLRNPYIARWELSLQRSLGTHAVFTLAYVGNRGTHLRVTRQLDAVPAQYLSTSPVRDNTRYALLTTNVTNPFYPLLPNTSLSGSTVQLMQLLRPYPQFTGVSSSTNDGFSWYHSLQANLQRRFHKNYQLTAAYTWSKFMEAIAYLNESAPAPYRVISNQDRPHRFVTSFIYQAPFWRGLQVQAIYQHQSGAPLNFGNVLYYGGNVAGARTASQWFNTQVFEKASAAQLVDNIRTFPLRLSNVRAMGLDMLDAGVSKSFRFGERVTLQVRADSFNALNRTHFGPPNTSPTSTDFGTITTTSQLPRIIEISMRAQF
jgi:hypothetical protein